MKYIKKINESNTINSENIYVIYVSSDTEIYDIYLDKKQAQDDCDKKNKEWNDYYKSNITLYSVKSLFNAIDLIKSYIRDEYSSHGDASY